MKRVNKVASFFMLSCALISASAYATDIKMSKASKNSFEITSTTNDNIQYVNCSVSKIKATETPTIEGTFVRLESEGMLNLGEPGHPELPCYVQLIEIPLKATVKVSVESSNSETISLSSKSISYKVYPAQEDACKLCPAAFSYDGNAYSKNAYINTNTVSFEEAGIMRDTRFGRLVVRPIQYNPSTNKIKVLNNLKVKIEFVNADYNATATLKEKGGSVYMKGLTSAFISSNLSQADAPKSNSNYQKETMIIVANSMFQSDLARFVTHKKSMGLNVIEHYVSTGTTRQTIRNMITNDYNNPPSGYRRPLYLLLVGDYEQIPAWGEYVSSGCATDDHPEWANYVTDVEYATLEGNDYIPDIFYGRFSARNSQELNSQINKTIEYETYSMPDPSYLYNATLVAGSDTFGSWTKANSQMIYAKNEYFNAQNNISADLYLQSSNGTISYTSQIASDVNAGVGYINYSAHGSPTGWYRQFDISDINNLNNAHKYGLWVGNCCLTNRFQEGECFGEALLRRDGKGAVGYIGASCCSYWNPDYYWSVGYRVSTSSTNPQFDASHLGMYDKLFHTHNIENINKFTTQGALIYAGNLSVQASSSTAAQSYLGGIGMCQYYWRIYHLMGDPSVNVRFTPPTSCVEDMTIVSNINDGLVHNEHLANRTITASNKIYNNSNVHYGANYSIKLAKGFRVYGGAKFRADLYGCNQGNINAMRKGSFLSDDFDEDSFDEAEAGTSNEFFSIYPNPTDGEFTIAFAAEDEEYTISVTDVAGKVFYTTSGTGREQLVNLEGKASGVYFVRVTVSDRSYVEKVIVK